MWGCFVGLAHAEELNRGIATEAFKTLPGDDKDMASAFRKQNEAELKNKGQLGAFEMTSVDDGLKNIQSLFTQFAQLPENTPEEIATKERAYSKLKSDSRMNRLRDLADLQIAQFFIPKTIANRDKLTTHSQYHTYLSQGSQIQDRGTSKAIAFEKRFFHWFLEFPSVFEKGGFDCILGNPPYLGGKRISGNFGDSYLNIVKYIHRPAEGGLDFVVYFVRRIYRIQKHNSFHSIITTNTISQGDSRRGGLEYLTKSGADIIFVADSISWPGKANVKVTLYSLFKGKWQNDRVLNNRKVQFISDLFEEVYEERPSTLNRNLSIAFCGSVLSGEGFILNKDLANQYLIEKKNSLIIKPFMNGDDLNNTLDQTAKRFVIDFKDLKENQAAEFHDCFNLVKEKVKPERDKVNRKTYRENWWQFAEKAVNLYKSIEKLDSVIVTARTSKTLAFVKVSSRQVFSANLTVFTFHDWFNFIILQSNIHSAWAWKYGTTLKSDLIYAPSDIINHFPFPDCTNIEMNINAGIHGELYHEYRRQFMQRLLFGLTKTYNLFHSNGINQNIINDKDKQVIGLRKHLEKAPDTISFEEAIQGILKLRQLHVEMDEAVLEAYGWHEDTEKWGKAIALRHDFYEVDYLPENDRVRYTIHPEARKEVLKRLLLLNHERYEEEIKQGLHKIADVEKFYTEKGQSVPPEVRLLMGSKGKEKKSTTKKKPQIDGGLFGNEEI